MQNAFQCFVPMKRSRPLFAAAILLALPSMAAAQSSSLFGNRGVTGSSGTLSNGVGANNSQAFGNSGNMTGFTGQGASSQSGFASGVQSSGSMPGSGNRNFVGNRNSAASTQGANGANGANAARGGLNGGGRNALSSGMSRNGQQNRNRGNQNRGAAAGAQSTPIRPVQVIAFTPPQRTTENIESSINADVESAVSQGRIPGIAVQVDAEGTATIEGHVASEADRRRASTLIGLEPGVRKVVNRITVSGQ